MTVPDGTPGPQGLADLMRLDRPTKVYTYGKATRVTRVKRSTRPRDSRRSKVYAAERSIGWGTTFTTLAACQNFIDGVTEARWFKSRWGSMQVPLICRSGGGSTGRYRGRINLGRGHWCELIALHELAHVLESSPGRVAHGPEFIACYLLLVKQVMGEDKARELRAALVERKVPVQTGVKALPKAGRYKVESKATQTAAKRRQATKPTTSYEREMAAILIRRAVAEGLYGPAGCKPRIHALATARALAPRKDA